jgi:hypothetical protein
MAVTATEHKHAIIVAQNGDEDMSVELYHPTEQFPDGRIIIIETALGARDARICAQLLNHAANLMEQLKRERTAKLKAQMTPDANKSAMPAHSTDTSFMWGTRE